MRTFLTLALCFLSAVWVGAETITATRFSMLGEPKYAEGFAHFDYVRSDAPKGGAITQAALGSSYDSFHRYALRGHAVDGAEYLYDTLFTPSEDESGVFYALIAEKIEYADDFSWIIFHINPAARAEDGLPLTAEDAAFSFDILYEKGVPQFKASYEGVTARALDSRRVRFDIPWKDDADTMANLLTLPVFAKRFWVDGAGKTLHDFSEPLSEPPLATGPYRVGAYSMGQSVTLSRVKDYWAADLPSRKGYFNFDTIRYDYYRDENVAFEAFKSGDYDYREENSARRWAVEYTGKLFDTGAIVREEATHSIPQRTQGFVFNTERPVFADAKVRAALGYFMDFEWMNKNLFYSQYARTKSYFTNTDYAASGLPSEAELAVLEPIRAQIPREVFTAEFAPPVNKGDGGIRDNVRKAVALLRDAGWELKSGKMVNAAGTRFSFELLIYDTSAERIAIPLQRNLARYGIELRLRLVDVSQYVNRLRSRDFDMVSSSFSAFAYPSSDLRYLWHSKYIDSTWNTPGVNDSAVDYLIDGIIARQGDKDALLAWGRALDRVLLWNHYCVPQWHISTFRLAYSAKFAKPAVRPKYSVGLDTWWTRAVGAN
jgi:microcin C transport system substrate-binding protein